MQKLNIINGKNHLMGRLASVCAKYLLRGNSIIVLNCSNIEISGKEVRNKYKYLSLFKKKTITNPKRGPFHLKSPSQVFWKVVRGMISHKSKQGSKALLRFRTYDTLPFCFLKIKKFVVPEALRILKLASNCKYSKLGQIFEKIGWVGKKITETSINKIKIENRAYYMNKQYKKSKNN